jgi:hypothetical protein
LLEKLGYLLMMTMMTMTVMVWQEVYGKGRMARGHQFRHGVSKWVEDDRRASALQTVTPETAVRHFQGWPPAHYVLP